MADEIVTAPQTEAPVEAPQTEQVPDAGDLDSLYAGVEFKGEAEKPEASPEATEEKPAEAVEEIKYEWEAPEVFKEQFLATEEGQKEYTEFQAFAKENGIKPEAFNHLMSKYADNVQKLQSGVTESYAKQWEETKKGWHQAILKDEEIGGKNYAESKKSAALALSEFGTPSLARELEETGFGHNPEIFKLLVRAGKSIGEGEFVRGKPLPAPQSAPWDKLYK